MKDISILLRMTSKSASAGPDSLSLGIYANPDSAEFASKVEGRAPLGRSRCAFFKNSKRLSAAVGAHVFMKIPGSTLPEKLMIVSFFTIV